jgi:hypothetical protein
MLLAAGIEIGHVTVASDYKALKLIPIEDVGNVDKRIATRTFDFLSS